MINERAKKRRSRTKCFCLAALGVFPRDPCAALPKNAWEGHPNHDKSRRPSIHSVVAPQAVYFLNQKVTFWKQATV